MLGGILIPFLVSFVDISLRTLLKEQLSTETLLYISFPLLLLMYAVAYLFLWRHFVKCKEIECVKLLELGTLSIIFSDLIIYASLYQAGNNLSNFIWLSFYLLLITLFYMLGKWSINHSQTNKEL